MGFERFGGPSGDSGKMYEARFLGSAKVDAKFFEELKKLPRDERNRFRSLNDVFRLFKQHYKDDPTDPKGVHAKELRGAMLDALELDERDFDKLKLYSTVGPPLDLMGFDAFVELEDPYTHQTSRATIDVTLRKEKVQEGWKADVIIGELPDAGQEEDEYLEAIESYAAKTAHLLQRRLGERNHRKAA